MSISQQLAVALGELEAEDVVVVSVDAPDHGMNVAGGCDDYCDCCYKK